jgi:hypothetical protein
MERIIVQLSAFRKKMSKNMSKNIKADPLPAEARTTRTISRTGGC